MSSGLFQGQFRGRGALSNEAGRFESSDLTPFDDGWAVDGLSERGQSVASPSLPTVIQPEVTRSLITTNSSPDIPFNQSINPYRGCEHGCVYCYARPSHAFLGLSPGLDFETRIFSKPDAANLLRSELSRRSYRPQVIALGANTDPYQPAEARLSITRAILEVLSESGHPVGILTKSAGILRDGDLLASMASRNLVSVNISVTSLDAELSAKLEPRASSPARRLHAIRSLSERGIPVHAMVSPIIPALTDSELERILDACQRAGARSASTILVRLPREVESLFTEWLDSHYPDRKEKVLALLREARDGRLNDPAFGSRMIGSGPYAQLIQQRFRKAASRLGLATRPRRLSFEHFRPPRGDRRQLGLFS